MSNSHEAEVSTAGYSLNTQGNLAVPAGQFDRNVGACACFIDTEGDSNGRVIGLVK